MIFDQKAQEKLGFYVYGLFDPQNANWPFYIGKGCGNRVFSHAAGDPPDQTEDEPISAKLHQIATIKDNGLTVIHKIIRFGLSEQEALKIEAALIDLINHIKPDTLKNQISGQGVAEGFYDAGDLALSLGAPELQSELPLLVIKIERQWTDLIKKHGSAAKVPRDEIFQATKGDWKISVARAQKADCVLAVARGIVRAAFVPSGWVDAGYDKRKTMTGEKENLFFRAFVDTSVAHLFEKGSQNPIRYLRC